MKKTYYEKIGRKYVPIGEYDSDFMNSFPDGSHLVIVRPGCTSRKYKIDPDYASLVAAGVVAEDAICKALINGSSIRRKNSNTPLTDEQKEAWERLIDLFGDEANSLEWPSAKEIAETAIFSMIKESEKLYANPVVKKAYDHFLLMCKLTKEESLD
jgi:hypothetical protein